MPKPDARARALFNSHYEVSARYGGDEAPKKAAAEAKRVATSLRKAVAQFGPLLDGKQLKSLQDAVVVMGGLGADLDRVCSMARAHKIKQASENEASYNARVDEVARLRWKGDEKAMLSEANELAAFVDRAVALDVDEWIMQRHPGIRYVQFPERLLGSSNRRLDVVLAGKPLNTLNVQRIAGEYLLTLGEATKRPRTYKDMYYVGLDDFEEWAAWRREIASAIKPR